MRTRRLRRMLAAPLLAAGLWASLGAAAAIPAAAAPATGRAVRAEALVHAAIVALASAKVFRTVTTSSSLKEVAVVEPHLAREAATTHVEGPAGRGLLKAVVIGGAEYMKGDARGWADLLRLLRAPAAIIARAPHLAGRWYVEPASRASLVDRFGPSLRGIGHVFCTGAACSLASARLVGAHAHRVVVAVPGFGGRLVLDAAHRLRPLELVGFGARRGVLMRFAYPASVPPVAAPSHPAPAPVAITH